MLFIGPVYNLPVKSPFIFALHSSVAIICDSFLLFSKAYTLHTDNAASGSVNLTVASERAEDHHDHR